MKVNDEFPPTSTHVPLLIMTKCTEECPEDCINDGTWKYRNKRHKPVTDLERRLYWIKGNDDNEFQCKF